MNDLDKIEYALRTTAMHHATLERFAQDMLSTVYSGLTPIPGGTDWGRDADIVTASSDAPPPRLVVTSARTLTGSARTCCAASRVCATTACPRAGWCWRTRPA